MDANRLRFIDEVAKAVRIDAGENTLEAIDKMTAHIHESQFAEFISELAEGKEYAVHLEKIKHTAKKFEAVIKDELWEEAIAEAKKFMPKLYRFFMQSESLFTPSATANKEIVAKFDTVRNYLRHCTIKECEYWTRGDVYIVSKKSLLELYDAREDSYRDEFDVVARIIYNAKVRKMFSSGNKKQISNEASNEAVKVLANNKQIWNKKGMK